MVYLPIVTKSDRSDKVKKFNFFSGDKLLATSNSTKNISFHTILQNKISFEKLRKNSHKIFFPANLLTQFNSYNHSFQKGRIQSQNIFDISTRSEIVNGNEKNLSKFVSNKDANRMGYASLFSEKLGTLSRINSKIHSKQQPPTANNVLIKSSFGPYNIRNDFFSFNKSSNSSGIISQFVADRIAESIKDYPINFRNINLQIKFSNMGKMYCSIFKSGKNTSVRFRTDSRKLSQILNLSFSSIRRNLQRKGLHLRLLTPIL
ncbi:MAG: hypothetical protein U9P79_03805 [Candidatus Cloacimonadota bacterium]|nr:hypothetical protein [Candidatus Cloacimonadota bacterium]